MQQTYLDRTVCGMLKLFASPTAKSSTDVTSIDMPFEKERDKFIAYDM